MIIGIRRVLRETLRGRVGIGAHICVRRSSSGGKGGRIGKRATLEGGIVVVLGVVGIELRRARGFSWNRGRKVNISLFVVMSVAVYDTVWTGVSLVNTGLAGRVRRVRWSHGPAD